MLEVNGLQVAAVSYLLMGTMIALLDLGAEGGGTACADVSECFTLLGRQHVSPAIQKFLTVLAEDIGDFKPTGCHRCRPSSQRYSIGFSCSASNGLGTFFIRARDTRR